MSAAHPDYEAEQEAADVSLFFGLVGTFFACFPLFIMFWRLVMRHREGLMAMFSPPYDVDPSKRRLSSRVRHYLYQQTSHGFKMDIMQAVFSAVSCLFFIFISYSQTEEAWIADFEDFFTVYFAIDYGTRLWLAQDTLSWYFSLTSMLDFITVIPAITVWLIQVGHEYDTNVAVIVASIRAFRVFRMFRVIRVIRLLSLSPSYAFQRQIFVLAATVLSLIFVAAGLYQITEGGAVKTFPFHKAVYYATITVVGRPGVPVDSIWTAAFLTVTVLLAVTVIPTFVAELIRLWYDTTSLETFKGNPETPHVLLCGDTNVSRLRALATQYFHKGRDADTQTPIVILAEAKPEGALRHFIDSYRFSGLVRYIRGSARRAADLRRVDLAHAKSCIVLNYRSDKEAAAADSEVLSTVMAIKNVAPHMRVLAQLYRPRKRNHLKAVPGWQDGDKSVSAVALGMTLMGLAARVPGFSTYVTNLVRHGSTLAGLPDRSLAGKALPWWYLMLYGDAAKTAALATLASSSGGSSVVEGARVSNRTPLEEYALSIEAGVHELPVNPALEGRSFGATARMAFLRYGITLMGATLPVNDDVFSLVPGLPKTYRLVLFPADAVLRRGMKLYGVCAKPEALDKFKAETGGVVRSALNKVVDTVGSAFVFGNSARTAPSLGAQQLNDGTDGDGFPAWNASASPASCVSDAGGSGGWHATGAVLGGHAHGGGAGEAHSAHGHHGHGHGHGLYRHNPAAATDLSVPWCMQEVEEIYAAEQALMHRLHLDAVGSGMAQALPVFNRFGQRHEGGACPGCMAAATRPQPLTLLQGQGVCVLGQAHTSGSANAAHATGVLAPDGPGVAVMGLKTGDLAAPAAPQHGITLTSDDFSFDRLAASSSVAAGTGSSSDAAAPADAGVASPGSGATGVAAVDPSAAGVSPAHIANPFADTPSGAETAAAFINAGTPVPAAGADTPTAAAAAAAAPISLSSPPIVIPRRTSLGDDGLGAIDDTDDIQGPRGPLLTQAPSLSSTFGIAVTARLAARANTNALAVRLALPVTAVTDVESMAADALDSLGAAGGAGGPALRGHVLVCGANDSMGYLLRAIASLSGDRTGVSTLDYGVHAATGAAGGLEAQEGDQYRVQEKEIVVLAPSRPADAAINAMYPGSARLLSRVTFMQGNPAEAADLLRAGVQTARAAVILTGSKASASADGGDNLTDDCDAIVTASILAKLAPGLHIVSELLHGGHAPYLRPAGVGLNDAQRGALIAVLEERESSRQRARIEAAIRQVAAEREIRTAGGGSSTARGHARSGASAAAAGGGSSHLVQVLAPGVVSLPPGVSRTDILLSKLTKQRMRLRAAMTGSLVFSRPGAGLGPAGVSAGSFSAAAGGGGRASRALSARGGDDGGWTGTASYSLSAPAGGSARGDPWGSAGSAAAAVANPMTSAGAGHGSHRGSGAPSSTSSASSSASGVGTLGAAVDALDMARASTLASRGGGGGGSSVVGGAAGGANITDADLEQLAESGLTNSAIVDVLVGVREDFGAASAVANEGAAISFGGAGAAGGTSKGSGATNDLFASPAFAAGRVFSFNTLDAVICEAHFDGSIVGVVKQLVRAARRQRFVAIPMTEAVIMARLAAPASPFGAGSVTPQVVGALREQYLAELAADIIATARGSAAGATTAAAGVAGAAADARPRTYGQLFEALLRGWRLLPLGLYRRVHPATGLKVNPQTAAALQLAAGPPSLNGAFVHNRALVSYVYTNPPADTLLSEHDLVYVLLPEASVSAEGVFNHGAAREDGDDGGEDV